MLCTQCGNKIDGASNFCHSCGLKVPDKPESVTIKNEQRDGSTTPLSTANTVDETKVSIKKSPNTPWYRNVPWWLLAIVSAVIGNIGMFVGVYFTTVQFFKQNYFDMNNRKQPIRFIIKFVCFLILLFAIAILNGVIKNIF